MAITASMALEEYQNANASSYTTATFTLNTDKLYLCWVYSYYGSTPVIPTVTGKGLTWTHVAESRGASAISSINVFRAVGTPTAGGLTVNYGVTQLNNATAVVEYTDTDLTGTNGSNAIVQTAGANGSTTPLVVTLSAFSDVGNATAGAFATSLSSATFPAVEAGDGFTRLGRVNGSNPSTQFATEFKGSNDTSVGMSFSGGGTGIGLALEIAVPSAGGGGQIKAKIAGTMTAKPVKTKIAGTFTTKPLKHKVAGTFISTTY